MKLIYPQHPHPEEEDPYIVFEPTWPGDDAA